MENYRILLVDDHKMIRHGIRSLFKGYDQYNVIAEASNGIEALRILERTAIDLVFMDVNMKAMDGVETTRKITKLYPETKIIAFTMTNESRQIKSMMNAGALGYVLKTCKAEELSKAVDMVMAEQTYYCTEVTETIMTSLVGKSTKTSWCPATQMPLTNREKEVLALILGQYTNGAIADKLHISIRTVEAHKRNLLDKTGSKNMAGVALYALKNDLIAVH